MPRIQGTLSETQDAKGKHGALRVVVFYGNTDHYRVSLEPLASAPGKVRDQHKCPRNNEQHGAGDQKGYEHPHTAIGVAELDREKWDSKQFMKSAKPGESFWEGRRGPQNSHSTDRP